MAAQSSQERKAVVARPCYDLHPELSQCQFCCSLVIRASHRPNPDSGRGDYTGGKKWRCGSLGVPRVTDRQSQCQGKKLLLAEVEADLGKLTLPVMVGVRWESGWEREGLPEASCTSSVSSEHLSEPSLRKTGLVRMDVSRGTEHLKAPPHHHGPRRGRRVGCFLHTTGSTRASTHACGPNGLLIGLNQQ